ncbi:MAG TPA: hypothetical protein VKP66_12690 [Steroidobacteraceae bacterium]|nr:hypothetical protein [Steroidobacteraceae bacterium]
MPDSPVPVALCCYKNRAVIANRCNACKAEYACPEFNSKAAVVKFNAMIPPSMLLAPLPIELWPSMAVDLPSGSSSQSTPCANRSTKSPVHRFVSTLVGGEHLTTPIDGDQQTT